MIKIRKEWLDVHLNDRILLASFLQFSLKEKNMKRVTSSVFIMTDMKEASVRKMFDNKYLRKKGATKFTYDPWAKKYF